jgi:hypothetical protein
MTLHPEPPRHLPDFLGIELDHVDAKTVTARLVIRSELLAPTGYLHSLHAARARRATAHPPAEQNDSMTLRANKRIDERTV